MRLMATLIDHSEKIEVRHPEKQRRPDAPIQRKPEWIRVRAPVSKGYQQTREIVRAKKLLVPILVSAGIKNMQL